jgi:predicted HicB family RNase H-like nuclease
MEGMKHVVARVPQATHTELKVAAARAGVPMAELLKKIVEDYLRERIKILERNENELGSVNS